VSGGGGGGGAGPVGRSLPSHTEAAAGVCLAPDVVAAPSLPFARQDEAPERAALARAKDRVAKLETELGAVKASIPSGRGAGSPARGNRLLGLMR
jgi:hypothetical protein